MELTEAQFKVLFRAMIDDVVIPHVEEIIKREVESRVKTVVYREMRDELYHEINKLITSTLNTQLKLKVEIKNEG